MAKDLINWEALTETMRRGYIEGAPRPGDGKKIAAAVQAYWNQPQKVAEKIQAMTFSSDIPEVDVANYTKFLQMVQYDNGWERAFRDVPVSAGRNSWKIYDIANGITFGKVREGERLKLEGISGTSATIYAYKYGGAIGWTDEMIRFRELAVISEQAELMRNRYWKNKADDHYNLIYTAANDPTRTTSYQGAATDTQLNRDTSTVNEAAYIVGNRLKGKGYGMGRMVCYLNERMRVRGSRMQRALNTMLASGSQNGGLVNNIEYPVDFVYTWSDYVPTNKGILCLPGNKAQKADIVQPFTLTDQDILQLVNVMALWSYYGAGIGDEEQFQIVEFA